MLDPTKMISFLKNIILIILLAHFFELLVEGLARVLVFLVFLGNGRDSVASPGASKTPLLQV